MIVSHKHRYVFVELPLTGSTAISAELRENYDGVWTLFKHATYHDFLRIATSNEKNYFVFSCIRNPMDQAVSHYFKYKTNHNEMFTDPKRLRRKMGLYQKIFQVIDLRRFRYVQQEGIEFSDFFMKYYRWPYSNWSVLAHKDFDFVLRFENLQADFARMLDIMNIECVRPLPQRNMTAQKRRDFWTYYETPAVQRRAMKVFGPFMRQWHYEFPAHWSSQSISCWQQMQFDLFTSLRSIAWRYARRRI